MEPSDLHLQDRDPPDLSEIIELALIKNPACSVSRIRDAYHYVAHAFAGRRREDGTPYLKHLTEVAKKLTELGVDDNSIIAGLLHDTLEDIKGLTKEDLAKEFGADVAEIVEGVTKITTMGPEDEAGEHILMVDTIRNIKALHKLLLAVAGDIRVLLVKLADRLHNMRTISGKKDKNRQRVIANETLLVFAPLAARLGIWQIKSELEDLSFEVLHPEESKRIESLINQTEAERKKELSAIILETKEALESAGVKYFQVTGRPKHKFSIFNKMASQHLKFEEIYDLIAIRIIVDTNAACYHAFGIVHGLYAPIQGFFFDYIAKPKPNGYQSIHTKVTGPHNRTLEVQIRTQEMHQNAEFGNAAHWTYKEGSEGSKEAKSMRSLGNQLAAASAENTEIGDFMRAVLTDLFTDQVFVFTPRHDIIELPAGSTVIDFAFKVHTELALKLSGVKVDGKLVPFNTVLQNAQRVELITRSDAEPTHEWVKYAKSSHALSRIRTYLRKKEREVWAKIGRASIVRELESFHLDPQVNLSPSKLDPIIKSYDGVKTADDLYARVAEGLISIQSVVQRIRALYSVSKEPTPIPVSVGFDGTMEIGGKENKSIEFKRAKCCLPIPGDEVVGYITRGNGIRVHRRICPSAQALLAAEPERFFATTWQPSDAVYGVSLRIRCINRSGLLADITTAIAAKKTNISNVKLRAGGDAVVDITLTVDVKDATHANDIIAKLSGFASVISAYRVFSSISTVA